MLSSAPWEGVNKSAAAEATRCKSSHFCSTHAFLLPSELANGAVLVVRAKRNQLSGARAAQTPYVTEVTLLSLSQLITNVVALGPVVLPCICESRVGDQIPPEL